jgi:NTE family protein
MDKTALVIGGGGSRGAFAIGAIEVLREAGIQFQLVTGCSTGALIAPLVATDELVLLHKIYTTVHTSEVLVRRSGLDILTTGSIHDTRPLWKLINTHMSAARYQRVLASAMDVFVCATSLQDGKSYYFNPKKGRDGKPLSRDLFNRAIFASSSQPVLMPAVRVPAKDGDQFVDGAVREMVPLIKAVDEGASKIYAIALTPAQRPRLAQSFVELPDMVLRGLDILLEEICADDLESAQTTNEILKYVKSVRERVAPLIPESELAGVFQASPAMERILSRKVLELYVIRPEQELPSLGLDFEPKLMTRMLELGRSAAQHMLRTGAPGPRPGPAGRAGAVRPTRTRKAPARPTGRSSRRGVTT